MTATSAPLTGYEPSASCGAGAQGSRWRSPRNAAATLHSTFMVDLADPAELRRSHDAAAELFELAARRGGAVSGEHGIGLLKRGALARQWAEPALALHESIKRLLDPKGLLNPGKKLAR